MGVKNISIGDYVIIKSTKWEVVGFANKHVIEIVPVEPIPDGYSPRRQIADITQITEYIKRK